MPATIPIPKPNPAILPTVLYDRYGHQIATLQQYDRNVPVTEAEIPQVLKEAVVADEDRNFYHHGGVDVRGTLRALWPTSATAGPLQGGSTITQQYVKLAFTNQQRTLVRKVREAILASQLDRQASKDEILYRYLTLVYFGDGNYGIGAAAENYFHVPVSALNASQAATLAGLIPAPSARAPRENLAAAEAARELVLRRDAPAGLPHHRPVRRRPGPAAGPGQRRSRPAPRHGRLPPPDRDHRLSRLRRLRDPLAARSTIPASEVYGGGLRVQTTLDPAVQAAAYAAVRSTLSGTSPIPWRWPWPQSSHRPASCRPSSAAATSATAPTPRTTWRSAAAIRRRPGAPPFRWRRPAGPGRRITGGLRGRQPGSAWKPFVLATAFEQGIQPSATYYAPGVYQIPGCTVPAGQPASACQIHNDDPGSIHRQRTPSSLATVGLDQHRVRPGRPPGGLQQRGYHRQEAGHQLGLLLHAALLLLPELRPRRSRRLAPGHGVRLRRVRRPRPAGHADADPRDRHQRQARCWSTTSSRFRATTTALPANVADNVTNVLQGVITSGTGTAAQLGRPAAGKTGHRQQLHQRLVRRLHADPVRRRCGWATPTARRRPWGRSKASTRCSAAPGRRSPGSSS